jgi:hypothetical protein
MIPTDTKFIHPEDFNNLNYWTKKWGVSLHQLKDAILYTGSLNTDAIKTYLRKDSFFYHPLIGLKRMTQHTLQSLFEDAEIES